MQKSIRAAVCTAVFLCLTAVKMVAPAAASDWKAAMLPYLDRDDDYSQLLRMVERSWKSGDLPAGELEWPESPLERIQSVLELAAVDPMAALPKVTPSPQPSETDEALTFGYAAREAFLAQQAELTDQEAPENVCFDVVSLPFSANSPVAGYTSSGFGYRIHPIQNTLRFHYGTDFAADYGTEIHAFADGTVLEAGESDGYGNYVTIDHGDGYVTLYGHCSELLVSSGQWVRRGETIALVGQSGQATGPHLHFELMHDGVYLNPEFYFYA